jgi:hypothetical protein
MTIDPNLLLNMLIATIPLISIGVKIWHSVELIEYKLKIFNEKLARIESEARRRDQRTDQALGQLTEWATRSHNKPFSVRSPHDYPSDPPTDWGVE